MRAMRRAAVGCCLDLLHRTVHHGRCGKPVSRTCVATIGCLLLVVTVLDKHFPSTRSTQSGAARVQSYGVPSTPILQQPTGKWKQWQCEPDYCARFHHVRPITGHGRVCAQAQGTFQSRIITIMACTYNASTSNLITISNTMTRIQL